jgi:hypothetical protein
VTVEEEEIILATVGKKPDKEDNDEEVLAMVAHFIMTHYAEKEVIKKHCWNGARQRGSSPRMFWWDQPMHLDKEAPDGASNLDSNAGKE